MLRKEKERSPELFAGSHVSHPLQGPPPQMPWVIETSLLCLGPQWDVIGVYQLLLMKLGV